MPVQIGEIITSVRSVPDQAGDGASGSLLTPQLVQAIVERVLAMMKEDLRIENERRRIYNQQGDPYGRR